jgi:hypothetical protein
VSYFAKQSRNGSFCSVVGTLGSECENRRSSRIAFHQPTDSCASDRQMAAHALSDADNFHITNRLANDMIKDALAKPGMFEINFPDWDSFALRVASMVDLNVCLTNRQRTVFDYSSVATRAWPRNMSLICDKETTVSTLIRGRRWVGARPMG